MESTYKCSWSLYIILSYEIYHNILILILLALVPKITCDHEVTPTESVVFQWSETPAKSNATFPCPSNPLFEVVRYCDASGRWGEYDKGGCGTLKKDFTILVETSKKVV